MGGHLKAYLAGPDVFAPDEEARFTRMRTICDENGFIPLVPADNHPPEGLNGSELAAWIKAANVKMIRQSDVVIANISPFRGPHMDPGTAWEIGFAEALEKRIVLWSENRVPLVDRISTAAGDKKKIDSSGWLVEDLGLSENLMICAASSRLVVWPNFSDAIIAAKSVE